MLEGALLNTGHRMCQTRLRDGIDTAACNPVFSGAVCCHRLACCTKFGRSQRPGCQGPPRWKSEVPKATHRNLAQATSAQPAPPAPSPADRQAPRPMLHSAAWELPGQTHALHLPSRLPSPAVSEAARAEGIECTDSAVSSTRCRPRNERSGPMPTVPAAAGPRATGIRGKEALKTHSIWETTVWNVSTLRWRDGVAKSATVRTSQAITPNSRILNHLSWRI